MEKDEDQTVVEVSAEGVKLHGVYEDFRPAVQSAVATITHVLSVTENIVGLPADFLKYHLRRFRERYQERIEAVPPDDRQLPPVRVGCLILNQVAYAADEPSLQEMFADLLASASDKRRHRRVHPSFATTINQLTPRDCELLKELRNDLVVCDGGPIAERIFGRDQASAQISVTNLIRLGLAEWHYALPSIRSLTDSGDFARDFRWSSRSMGYGNDAILPIEDIQRGLEGAARRLLEKVERDLSSARSPSAIGLTAFGADFVEACLPPNDEPSSP